MSRPLNLLLVEDNEDDAYLISRSLSRGGFEPKVRRVENESELRLALTEQSWDVILSDYTLPAITCGRVLEILGESKLDIPFICISGVHFAVIVPIIQPDRLYAPAASHRGPTRWRRVISAHFLAYSRSARTDVS